MRYASLTLFISHISAVMVKLIYLLYESITRSGGKENG